ncbi:MAG: class I adenylate-forming enzyme family protein [Bryobacteraceae bacterium]
MIYQLVQEMAGGNPAKPFVIEAGGVCNYGDMVARARCTAGHLVNRGITRFLVYLDDSAELICLLLAANLAGAQVAVVNRRYGAEELRSAAETAGMSDLVTAETIQGFAGRQVLFRELDSPEAGEYGGPSLHLASRVVILTTGTTGRPKGAVYSWERLVKQIKVKTGHEASRWLLLYNLNHFAGYQVLIHVLCNRATLVIPRSREPRDVAAAMDQGRVTHVSATPTFWRVFLGQMGHLDFGNLCIQQITLGGEAADGPLLDALARAFPAAAITQVYATTEFGSCFSVNDGKPGFPVSLLENHSREIQLKIIGDELYVRSPYAMLRYTGGESGEPAGWQPTGDMVAIEGDRVRFLGRKSEIINVGGVKVHPLEVESVVQGTAGVRFVRAYGKKNPVTGSLVAVDVQLEEGASPGEVEREIRARCTRTLDRYKQPRIIQFVSDLARANEKILRRGAEE